MKQVFFKILVNTLSILFVAWLLSGIHLENGFTAIMVAVTLALFSTFVRPLLVLIIPPTAVILGLSLLLINTGVIMLAGEFIPGFEVASFWTAFWFGILMSIVRFFLELPEKLRQHQIIFKYMRTFEDPFSDENLEISDHLQDFQDAEIMEEDAN